MKRHLKRGFYSFGAETEIEDGYIHYRPEIVIRGDFHEGIGRLLLDVLNDRVKDVLHDISAYLVKPDRSGAPSEEVAE